MTRNRISDVEIALIKGLGVYHQLNDQQVLAIFSHLARDLNSRDIGFIRKGERSRYAEIAPASKEEVDEFLEKYSKIEEIAERIGIYQTSDENLSLFQALDYARSAVSIFNNNIILARSQIFIILMNVEWTYAAHVKLRSVGIAPVYVDDRGNEILTDGKPKMWDLAHCCTRPELQISEGEKNNLRYMILLRNEIEHRSSEDINEEGQSKLQANALNFVNFMRRNFGRKFDPSGDFSFAIQLHSLKMKQTSLLKSSKGMSKAVAAVNALVEKDMSSAEYNDPEYAFRVYVVPKVVNNEKKSDQAVIFSPVGSNVEVAIKQVERPKYRLSEVAKMLKEDGIEGVTVQRCVDAWKAHDLKNPAKGLAVELGKQWFWYLEGVDAIKAALAAK